MAARSTRQMRVQAAALHAGTPTVTSPFRTLTLYRAARTPGVSPRLLIERTVKDPSTRATRIFGARALLNEATANADAVTVTALDGRPLSLHTADGDLSLRLLDSAGRPLWSLNAQQTATAMTYEAASLSGRPLSLSEMAAGAAGRVRERYSYAPAGEAYWKAHNLAGRLWESRNNAGIDRSLSLSLTGQSLASEQCLLKIEIEQPDWSRTSDEDVEAPLEVFNQLDATGALLSTTHAAGVTTFEAYGISGAREQTRVRYMKGDEAEEVVTLRDVRYAANSRLLEQIAGNGVVDRYEYDARIPRLKRHLTARPAGHPLGSLVISDLHYEHDPAGNILSLDDQGADPEWHKNLEATGLRHYAYDTLNRLVSATGRERVPAARHHPSSGTRSDPSAGQVWAPYKEEYCYDDGNNLWLIRHIAGEGLRTVELDVARGSNRAVVKGQGYTPETGFLPGGLQKQLGDGRTVHWHADNQLRAVSLVGREHEEDDSERYHYDAGGSRVRKVHSVKVGSVWQITLTTYTHAYEHRQRWQADENALQRDVLITTLGTARLVTDQLNGVSQLRYDLNDHLHSSAGEADAIGKVIAREEYAPYGCTVGSDEAESEVNNLTQRAIRHAGKERDATGLYYYGWRYCQPLTGHWLSADPGGLVDGINLFRLASSSPVTVRDLNGKQTVYSKQLIDKHADGYAPTEEARRRLGARTDNDSEMDRELTHELYDFQNRVISRYKTGGDYAFDNEYRPQVWLMRDNARKPGSHTYASTVVLEQYRMVSKAKGFYGVLPKSILRFGVVNKDAIKAATVTPEEKLLEPEERNRRVVDRFLASPANGSHTRRILEALGMEATAVTLHEYVQDLQTAIIEIEVRPRSLEVEAGPVISMETLDMWAKEYSALGERQMRQLNRGWLSRRLHAIGHRVSDYLRSFRNRRIRPVTS